MTHGTNLSQEMRDCIQDCVACHALCLETVKHSLGLGGPACRGQAHQYAARLCGYLSDERAFHAVRLRLPYTNVRRMRRGLSRLCR
jgi:hypothetical protein